MTLNLNDEYLVPDYGSDAPVIPLQKGNIDITSNGYANYLKSAYGSMMITQDGKMYTLIPKVDAIGSAIEDQVAYKLYKKTGGHLGQFASEEEATIYAKWLRGRAKEVATYLPDDVRISTSGNPMLMDVERIDAEAKMARNAIRMKISKTRGLSAKGLGQRISAASEPFDPNAEDGDGDGVVQDGTQWARPSLPGAPVIASMRSLGSGGTFVPENTRRVAKAMSDIYKANEPRITERMKEIEQLADRRAKLVDLDSRLKEVDSLASKIERLKGAWNNDVTAAASQMNDGLRYTFVVNKDDDYSAFVKSVASMLRSDGHRVTSWNYWDSKDPYQGINMMVQDKAGFNYEIQFHTKASHAVKKKLEPLYREFRDEKNPSKRKEIYDRMRAQTKSAPKPAGVAGIGEHIERGYTASNFTPAVAQDTLLKRANNVSMRSGMATDILDNVESLKRDAEVAAQGRKVLVGTRRGQGPLSGKKLFKERGEQEVPVSEEQQQQIADQIVRAWLNAAAAYIYGKYYWEGGPSADGILMPPMHPDYASTRRFDSSSASPIASLGPMPKNSVVKRGLPDDVNRIVTEDDAAEVRQNLMTAVLSLVQDMVGFIPKNLMSPERKRGETSRPKYKLSDGDWSFLSWIPTLAGTPKQDDSDAQEKLSKRWEQLTEFINPALKFKGGASHVFATKTTKSEEYDPGTDSVIVTETAEAMPNDLGLAILRIAQTVKGAFGKERGRQAGDLTDSRRLKDVLDPETGLPKLDERGKKIRTGYTPRATSLNVSVGRNRFDEIGDLLDSGGDVSEDVVNEGGADDVLASMAGRMAATPGVSAYDFGNIPDANDKAAYDDLLQAVAAVTTPEFGEQLKELHESAPKFARMIVDRYLFGDSFEGELADLRAAIARRHGVSPSAVDVLFGTSGKKKTNLLGIDDETGKLKLNQLVENIRNAYPQIASSIESQGDSVNQGKLAEAISKQFGIAKNLALALIGDIAPEATGLARVRNRELASQESVLDLVGSLLAQGQGRQSVLNALFSLLRPEANLPQKPSGAQDTGNTNKQIAQLLSKLLGRPVTAGSLNAVFQELGIDLTQNGAKEDDIFSTRRNQRFVLRYSAKSLIGVFEGCDEVAVPPNL